MNTIQNILKSYIFIKFLFIVSGFYLIAAYSADNELISNCNKLNHPTTELVVNVEPESNIFFNEQETGQKDDCDFSYVHISNFTKYKSALFNYNHYVQNQLSVLKCSFSPFHHIITTLQKCCIWHQSSNEDHFYFA